MSINVLFFVIFILFFISLGLLSRELGRLAFHIDLIAAGTQSITNHNENEINLLRCRIEKLEKKEKKHGSSGSQRTKTGKGL